MPFLFSRSPPPPVADTWLGGSISSNAIGGHFLCVHLKKIDFEGGEQRDRTVSRMLLALHVANPDSIQASYMVS